MPSKIRSQIDGASPNQSPSPSSPSLHHLIKSSRLTFPKEDALADFADHLCGLAQDDRDWVRRLSFSIEIRYSGDVDGKRDHQEQQRGTLQKSSSQAGSCQSMPLGFAILIDLAQQWGYSILG
jgi:hypothetical protein